MPVVHIDAADDPRVADYTALGDPQLLRDRGLFVAEGRLVVRRLIESTRFRVRSLLVTDSALHAIEDLVTKVATPLTIYLAPLDLFEGITGFNIHRGCLAIGERPAAASIDPLVASTDLLVVLERVSDADNVGAIFRHAAAFGAGALLLSPGCCDPLYRKAIRTSSGAAFAVPFAEVSPWPRTLGRLKAAGFALMALTPRNADIDISALARTGELHERVAVLLGTEGRGLTPEAAAMADCRVCIPITGTVDSLNVATAGAIALQRIDEVRRVRRGE
jgi:tRNA G18 (ribose-2'-O)-methylase SpoU